MLGILRKGKGEAYDILNTFELNFSALRKKIELLHEAGAAAAEVNDKKSLHLTKQAEKALKTTFLEAKLYKSDAISTANFDVFYEDVKEVFQELFTGSKEEDITESPVAETPPEDFNDPQKNPYQGSKGKVVKKSKTPVLDNFGRDLTLMAEAGKLDPVVGRKQEIERISQILSRRRTGCW